MRQRDDVDLEAVPCRAQIAADERVELLADRLLAEHLGDRERANREHELGLQDLDLASEERTTARDLLEVRLAIAAAARLAREAARDRSNVDARAEGILVDSHRLLEPAEERLAGGPGEGTTEAALARPRRLPHEDDLGEHGWPVDDRTDHLRAETTPVELVVERAQPDQLRSHEAVLSKVIAPRSVPRAQARAKAPGDAPRPVATQRDADHDAEDGEPRHREQHEADAVIAEACVHEIRDDIEREKQRA